MGKIINFGTKVFYYDPEYTGIEIMVNGRVGFEAPGREDDPELEETVRTVVNQQVMEKSQALSGQKVSYKDLINHSHEFGESLMNQLKPSGVNVTSVSIAAVNPTEDSRKHIADVEKIKEYSRMTPEDMNEALRKAQEAAAAYAAKTSMMGAAAAAAGPKFCTQCGSAANGARFCPNCGTKLV